MSSKKEILKKVLETPFEKLVPSYIFKSELLFLNEDEFKKIMKHKRIDDYNGQDTFVIGSYIFKLKKETKEKIVINI